MVTSLVSNEIQKTKDRSDVRLISGLSLYYRFSDKLYEMKTKVFRVFDQIYPSGTAAS